jgi:hypothetical protein
VTDVDKTVLGRRVLPIVNRNSERIAKDSNGLFEADSMFMKINLGLVFVPFKLESHRQPLL